MTTNHKARQSPSARRRALKTPTTTSARNLSRGRAVHINVDGGLVADSTTFVSSAEHSAPAWVAAVKTTAAGSPEAVGNETLSTQTQLASLSTYELIALISDQLDHRPELSPVSTKVAALLHLSPALAGEAEALGTRSNKLALRQQLDTGSLTSRCTPPLRWPPRLVARRRTAVWLRVCETKQRLWGFP